ncbi:MAG: hypothetical protein KAQ89_04275 [Planctomycetes bacterium]|nr:hypothetical protein [Planctomycetota bacterium]
MKILKDTPKCFFWQEGKCIVHSLWWCQICPWRIKKISNLTEIKSYLDFVHTRYSARRSFIMSIIAVAVATISTFIAFLVLLTNEKAVALLQGWFS